MSKYNSYAKKLETAFISARTEYTDAYEKMQKVEQARAEASQWQVEKYIGENAARKARAEADYIEAREAFGVAEARIWSEFNAQRSAIKAELAEAVKKDSVATPDAIDQSALELLKSGILTSDDYYNFADKFDGNPTMLRLIAKYARDAAEDTDDRKERATLNAVAAACSDGLGSVMRSWDALSSIADYCSGQAHGRKESPGYIVSMGKWWEQLADETVENF